MKIGQKPELPATLVQTGLAKQAKAPASAAEGAIKGAKMASTAGVPVLLTANSSRSLERADRAQGDFDAERVKAMRDAIAKGDFKINAGAIADSMLANAQEIFMHARA